MLRTIAIALFALVFAVSSARAETVSLEHDGLSLLGDVEGGLEAGQFVVLVHGTLAHKDMELMEAMQTALADHDVGSLAISLSLAESDREGMFDCTHVHRHQMGDAVKEIGAWLEWLAERRDAPVVLLGHSRGGAQVAWYAAESPHPSLEGVVLLAPAYEASLAERMASYEERFGGDLGRAIREARDLVEAGEAETLIDVPGFLYCPDTQASAEAVISYYDNDERRDSPTMTARGTLPTLVIAGSEDAVVPLVEPRFQELSEGSRVTLEVIEGAGHMFLDFFAEDAAAMVASFNPGS